MRSYLIYKEVGKYNATIGLIHRELEALLNITKTNYNQPEKLERSVLPCIYFLKRTKKLKTTELVAGTTK